MSYLTRHFQMRGAIVGNMPNHTDRALMHKKLHRADVPTKALIAYGRALAGSVNVQNHIGAKVVPSLNCQQYGGRANVSQVQA